MKGHGTVFQRRGVEITTAIALLRGSPVWWTEDGALSYFLAPLSAASGAGSRSMMVPRAGHGKQPVPSQGPCSALHQHGQLWAPQEEHCIPYSFTEALLCRVKGLEAS